MLTAVQGFVKDAMGEGSSELETLQFGDHQLIMERMSDYLLIVDVEGRPSAELRAAVGDMLALILRRHQEILDGWKGDIELARPVEAHLERLVDRYNLTGAV